MHDACTLDLLSYLYSLLVVCYACQGLQIEEIVRYFVFLWRQKGDTGKKSLSDPSILGDDSGFKFRLNFGI